MSDGSYRSISDLNVGDELFSAFATEPIFVKSLVRTAVEAHMRKHIMTILPHACGEGQPSREVVITRNHAIRCPRLMFEHGVPDDMLTKLHMYPENLPTTSVDLKPRDVSHVCNVDVGHPEIPLMTEGLLTESWDGKQPTDQRYQAWGSYNNTVFMKRYDIEHILEEVRV